MPKTALNQFSFIVKSRFQKWCHSINHIQLPNSVFIVTILYLISLPIGGTEYNCIVPKGLNHQPGGQKSINNTISLRMTDGWQRTHGNPRSLAALRGPISHCAAHGTVFDLHAALIETLLQIRHGVPSPGAGVFIYRRQLRYLRRPTARNEPTPTCEENQVPLKVADSVWHLSPTVMSDSHRQTPTRRNSRIVSAVWTRHKAVVPC